ncbi:MAG: endonuclease/exonuclease/phosphatase family protein [Planctomycetes bacterium]|nr:endonuclease/exonuclease/phosphatase family protein [Planctomycetota bacterium]
MSPEPGRLRIVSHNLAHGRGSARHQALVRPGDIRRNLDRIAAFLRATAPDVAALQEVDFECTWSGRFNHLDYLAERTGLVHRVFSAHTNIRRPPLGPLRYGTAVLARHPIDLHLAHSFQRRLTGRKGFCAATVRLGSGAVDVVSVHLDFIRSTTRSRQLSSMIEVLDVLGTERPLVIAGDFNACSIAEYPLFRVLEEWRDLRRMPFLFAETATYPSARPRHAIDHVWATPGLRFRSYRVHPVHLSDHLPIEVVLERR